MQKSFPPKETATASKTATSQECQPTTQNDQNPTRGVNFQPVERVNFQAVLTAPILNLIAARFAKEA